VGVESGHKDAVFVKEPVRPFLLLVPVLSEGSKQCGEASQTTSRQGMQAHGGHERSRRCPSVRSRGVMRAATLIRVSIASRSGHFPELGSEQAGIDGPCALEDFEVDRDVDQGIKPTDRANVAGFGAESTPGLWPDC
jgi:hypothetical protein